MLSYLLKTENKKHLLRGAFLELRFTKTRARDGQSLPVDIPYFLESYEACIQITEWLEQEIDERWHSTARESMKNNSSNTASSNSGTTEEGSSDAISLSDIALEEIAKPKRQRKKKTQPPSQQLEFSHQADIKANDCHRDYRRISQPLIACLWLKVYDYG